MLCKKHNDGAGFAKETAKAGGEIGEKANEYVIRDARSRIQDTEAKRRKLVAPQTVGASRSVFHLVRGEDGFFDCVPRVGRLGKGAANPRLSDATPLEFVELARIARRKEGHERENDQ